MLTQIRTTYDVGQAIKRLRRHKQLTGGDLGQKVGISQSKVSKIETGATLPSPGELNTILNILECPKKIRQQVLAVLEIASSAHLYKYSPLLINFDQLYKKEITTRYIRCFLFNLLPVLLQTAAYREAVLKHWRLTQHELSRGMSEAVKRQDLLWQPGHEYHFIVHEAALYTTPGSARLQLEQLDRIQRISNVNHIKIGVIPLKTGLPTVENSNFIIYDTTSVTLIVATQEMSSEDPQEIAEHLKLFNDLDQRAYYRNEARDLIDKAIQYFTR